MRTNVGQALSPVAPAISAILSRSLTVAALNEASYYYMPQVTIYLDGDTEKRARAAADASGDSLSRWISGVIREKTATTWPQQVLDLAGSWPDFPLAEELRQGQKGDNRRERL